MEIAKRTDRFSVGINMAIMQAISADFILLGNCSNAFDGTTKVNALITLSGTSVVLRCLPLAFWLQDHVATKISRKQM